MNLRVEANSLAPIRRSGVETLTDVIGDGGVPRGPAMPSIQDLAGSSISLNPAARAIEDLKRSGYRPLHPAWSNTPVVSRFRVASDVRGCS